MKYLRIIPKLDIKGPNLVKGIQMEGLRVLGRPEAFAELYYSQGADELIYQDTVASLYQRNNLTEIVSRTSKNIFIPLTVGGGIRSLKDINKVLRVGADKVAINTAALNNPNLINKSSKTFGSSTIVIAIEAIRMENGSYFAFTDNGREETGREVLSWAREAEDRGAGEILLTSINNEGTGNGYDLDLIKMISSSLSIPVIAHGGAGNISDIVDSIKIAGADAVSMASMLHYTSLKKSTNFLDQFRTEGNIDFLSKEHTFKMFGKENLSEIKRALLANDIPLRLIN